MNASRLLADIRPLQESPAYRRLWLGSGLSAFGSQMTTFAVALQVFRLSQSSTAVGAVGLSFAVPAIGISLIGGTLVDTVDRRRLVLITSAVQASISIALAAQAFAGSDALGLLYGLTALQGGISAVDNPARRTFVPRLVRRELVQAAAALTSVSMYAAVILGPGIAGLITAGGGLEFCSAVDAFTFIAALYSVFRLPAMPPQRLAGAAERTRRDLHAVVAGFRFVIANRPLRGALLADASATILAMPIALFPAINSDRFGGSPTTLGLLSTAVGVGGLLGAALSGPIRHVIRPGRAMLIAGSIWGAALATFGVVDNLPVSLGLLVLAGAADVLAVVFRTSIVQLVTPDAMRGRTGSAEFVVGVAFPQVGNFRAGVVAGATSAGFSALTGGLAAVAGAALIGLLLPTFRRYRPADAAGVRYS